ncbi:MAG: nucleotidyltransferase family protein, partial [Saezia sp.]
GDGSRWGLKIHYCMEQQSFGQALGTAGGIINALPYVGDAFWLISGDIYAPDFDYTAAIAQQFIQSGQLARLWVIPNPSYHPEGDFGIDQNGLGLARQSGPDGKLWTYASIALMRAELFAGLPASPDTSFIDPILQQMQQKRIEVAPYHGRFENVGTPEQLAQVNAL